MATAAAGGGRASAMSKTVDESLWWDSFVVLANELENAPLSSELPPSLVIKLRSHQAWFLNSCSMFKPPSDTSKRALEAEEIIIGSYRLAVLPELKDMALQFSSLLGLDAVQSYIILSRSIESNNILADIKAQQFLHLVSLQYFLERQCLLKCIREILSRSLNVGNDLDASDAVQDVAFQLISSGLERKLLNVLQNLVSCKHLEWMETDLATLWVEEALVEVNLLLDTIFIIYYENLSSCKCEQWKSLCSLFKGILSDSLSIGTLATSNEARNLLYLVKVKLLLILIETLDLEALLGMVRDGMPFRDENFVFSIVDVQELDSLVSNFNTSDETEAGPLILTWAVLLCLIASLPDSQKHNILVEIDHIGYVRQAFEAAPLRYLLEILDSNILKDSDGPVTGYRSVMRTFISAFVASYEINQQLEGSISSQIVDVLCKIYTGEESLCIQFWDKDSFVESPIRSLLCSLGAEFPFRMVDFIRLLSALAEGAWPAECVYNFLEKMVGITTPFEMPDSSAEHSCQIVQACVPLCLPAFDGVFIPHQTYGRVLKIMDGNIALVRWECILSGTYILILRLGQEFQSNGYEDVFVILDLLSRLVSFSTDVSFALMNIDSSLAVQTARINGHIESNLHLDVVKIICVMINKLSASIGSGRLMSLCINILCSTLKCSPSYVVDVATTTNIFDLCIDSPSDELLSLTGGLAKMMLVDCGENKESCSLTLSVIEFAIQLVEAGVDNDMSSSLVVFLLQFVLVNVEHWTYKLRHARWKVILKVLELAKRCTKSVQDVPKLGCIVRDILLGDSSVHDTFLRIMCIMTPTLERLSICRLYEMKEIEGLQCGLHSVLDIVYAMLSDFSQDLHLGLSVFHHAMLSSATKPFPVAQAVISLLSFFRNSTIQVAAAKVLSRLFALAVKGQPYAVGNASFVSDEMQIRELSLSIQKILSDATVSNEELSMAVLELLTSAALYQPAFLLSLFAAKEDTDSALSKNGDKKELLIASSVQFLRPNDANLLSSLLYYLARSDDLFQSHPRLLLNVLKFLKAIWRGPSQYFQILEAIKNSENFWENLSSILPISERKRTFSSENVKNDEGSCLAYQYMSQTAVLEIMAQEIFLQKKRSDDSTLEERSTKVCEQQIVSTTNIEKGNSGISVGLAGILSSWCKSSVMEELVQSYASCSNEKGIVLRAKIAACMCITHLMEKMSVGDTLSLSISLLDKIRKISEKLKEHPAFAELLAWYTSRGYREGDEANALILSDLFFHLQGELEGREITPGPFRELSQYLLQLEIFRTKGSGMDMLTSDKLADFFDIMHLKKQLRLEYWVQSRSKASKEIVGQMLLHMDDANKTVLNVVSKNSALKALNAILAVHFQNVIGHSTASSSTAVSETFIKSCIGNLCRHLQVTTESLVPFSDFSNETLSFIFTQAELLLILVRVLSTPTIKQESKSQCMPVILETLVPCLRVLTDVKSSLILKRTLNLLLTLLLTSLKLSNSTSDPQDKLVTFDSSGEDTLLTLSVLPILCSCLETAECCNVSLSAIDTVLKGFLTPNSWLPVLQRHFNLQLILSMLQKKESHISVSVILKLLLTLARTSGGAKMLQTASMFSYLKGLFGWLFDGTSAPINQAEGNIQAAFQNEEKEEKLWGLGMAIVTAMVYSLGGDPSCLTFVESIIPFFLVEKAYMMLYYLCAPDFQTDDHCKKRPRSQKTKISLTSLVEIEQTLMLVCTLAKHQQVQRRANNEIDSQFRQRSIHFLAFLSRAGPRIGDGTQRTAPFLCVPQFKEEIELSERPPFVNSKNGWFTLSALSCAAKSSATSASGSSLLVGLVKDRVRDRVDLVSRTYFSDVVAIEMYKIAFLLLKFLCQQAKDAARRAEEVGFVDLAHFPELPMPEILHGLQDQAMVIVTELCKVEKSKLVRTDTLAICFLLLQITEKALCLEFCVCQSCGIRPVLGRIEDFSKEIKTLTQAAEQHEFLKASIKSLKEITALLYPGLLQTEGIL